MTEPCARRAPRHPRAPRQRLPRTLFAVGVAISTWGCIGPLSEEFETHYADVPAARAKGALRLGGWLPEIIPEDAVDIWELHNIDTNRTWACFRTPRGHQSLRSLLASKGARPASGPIDRGPTRLLRVRPWWLSSMRTDAIEAYSLAEAPDSSLAIGIDVRANGVCVHRRSASTADWERSRQPSSCP